MGAAEASRGAPSCESYSPQTPGRTPASNSQTTLADLVKLDKADTEAPTWSSQVNIHMTLGPLKLWFLPRQY